MEFGVALFGAIVSTTLPKIVKLIRSTALPIEELESINVTFGGLKAALQDIQVSSIGKYATASQLFWVAQLCRKAAEIEDCLDSFKAGKIDSGKFSAKIKKLEVSVGKNEERMTKMENMVKSLKAASSAPGQQQDRSAVYGLSVPKIFQDLLNKKSNQSMPSNLNCLLYLCLFPINHPVERNPLIRRWLAEGLVLVEPVHDDDDDDDGKRPCSLEDVAEKYLDILLANKIIQPIEESKGQKVKKYETPQEIHKFISKLSSTTSFMTFCDHMVRQEAELEARRLSVRPGSSTAVPEWKRQLIVPEGFSRVRSLAVFPDKEPVSYKAVLDFQKYEVLRLLDLKQCDALTKDDLNLTAIFKQQLMLRYLSLGDKITHVPKAVVNLKMLETLDLGRTAAVAVYSEILELPCLKHLLGKLDLCTKDIWGGRKGDLKKFLSDGTDKGSQLETLSGYVTGERQGFAMVMSYMTKLKKVKIWCDSIPGKANLKILKKSIEKFISESSGRSICIDFQEGNFEQNQKKKESDMSDKERPKFQKRKKEFRECFRNFIDSLTAHSLPSAVLPGPGSIVSLKLRGILRESGILTKTKFPSIAKMTGIKEICLSSTELTGKEIMDGLNGLPYLVYLKLVEEELWPLEISLEFPKLKQIFLVGNRNLGITVADNALSGLVSLYLDCETLGTYTPPLNPIAQPISTAERITLAANVKINHMKKLKKIVLHSALRGNAADDWVTAVGMHPETVKPVVSFLPALAPAPVP